MSSHPTATFSRREFMVYERVMAGRAHHEAAVEVDAALAKDTAADPLEQFSWAQWGLDSSGPSARPAAAPAAPRR